jgi:hypothetical protein
VEERCGIVEGIGQAGIVDGLVLVLVVGAVVAECCCSKMLHLDQQMASRLAPRVRSSKEVVMVRSSQGPVFEQGHLELEGLEAHFEVHN